MIPRARIRNAAAGLVLAAAFFCAASRTGPRHAESLPDIAVAELPEEGREVLAQIHRGGPFRYDRDGVVFGNSEKLLPLNTRAIITSTRCIRRGRRTAARAGSSAVDPAGAGGVLLHRRPLSVVQEDPRMKAPDLDPCRRRRRPEWTGATDRPQGGRGARASHSSRPTSARPRIARRCSPKSTGPSSCRTISATISTRSPTCSRIATGWARPAA